MKGKLILLLLLFIGLMFSIQACKSWVGITYTYIPLKQSLTLIPSNDSSAVLYFANVMPVAQWKYHIIERRGRMRQIVMVDTIEILDKKIVEYLEDSNSKSFDDRIACKGDTAYILEHIFAVSDGMGQLKSQYYNLKKRRMRCGLKIKNCAGVLIRMGEPSSLPTDKSKNN